MSKRLFSVFVLAAIVAGGIFAQEAAAPKKGLFSAGAYADFMALSGTTEVGGGTTKNATTGGGFGVFLDAAYAELGLGLDFANNKDPDQSSDKGTDLTYFSLSLLGKYPISLGEKLVFFPTVGFDANIFMGGKNVASGTEIKTADLTGDYEGMYDAFLIDFGVGADYALSNALYLRGSFVYGLKLNSKFDQKTIDDYSAKVFNGGITIKVAVGYKF
jgi:hypothetical protein